VKGGQGRQGAGLVSIWVSRGRLAAVGAAERRHNRACTWGRALAGWRGGWRDGSGGGEGTVAKNVVGEWELEVSRVGGCFTGES
jgi:hypothetical protein